MGYNPAKAIDTWTNFAAIETEKDLTTPAAFEQLGYPMPVPCTELASKGFKDTSNSWLKVKQTEWTDSHHSYCYRAFNMTREISFHNYKWNTFVTPNELLELNKNWNIVQNSALPFIEAANTCKNKTPENQSQLIVQ